MRASIITESTTQQADTFLTLAAVKEGIRVRHSHEDSKITRLRDGAIVSCENYARIAILPKVARCVVRGLSWRDDEFCLDRRKQDPDRIANGVNLPFPLVTAITSVKALDKAGNKTVIDVSFYELDDDKKRIVWKKNLPSAKEYEIVYSVGYASNSSDIRTNALRDAVIEVVQDRYDNPGQSSKLPASARSILLPFFTTRHQS